MAKHDIDLLIFDVMISLGIFDSTPSIYDVMRELKVTRNKARNLIYEHQLRSVENENQLLAELREVLRCPLLSRKSDNGRNGVRHLCAPRVNKMTSHKLERFD